MRLWSLHPRYLDAKGLVALWREGLLARAVLQGQTKGYQRHPQLARFRKCPNPIAAIDQYLLAIYAEAEKRGYKFDSTKLGLKAKCLKIPVTKGQLEFEWCHLESKLKSRNPSQNQKNQRISRCQPHPLFQIIPGDIAFWEKRSGNRNQDQINKPFSPL